MNPYIHVILLYFYATQTNKHNESQIVETCRLKDFNLPRMTPSVLNINYSYYLLNDTPNEKHS